MKHASMKNKPRYLSKSRFRTSLECATKLYYSGKKEYSDQKNANDFLRELAKGGIQIGEYAKYFFSDDPQGITVNTKPYEYEESIKQTKERLAKPGDVVIAEAAFLHNNCYVRADILQRKNGVLYLYEVKAKSWSSDTEFTKKNGSPSLSWAAYLYDVAFQKWVIENSTAQDVKAHLMLVNKDAVCDTPGLAKHFKIVSDEAGQVAVVLTPGLTRKQLGNKLLVEINVDDQCDWIYTNPIETDLATPYSFEDYIQFVSEKYANDKKIVTPIGTKCKGCEFYTKVQDEALEKRSGRKECWVGGGAVTDAQFNESLVIELWGGKSGNNSPIENLLEANKFLLKDAERSDFDNKLISEVDELKPHHRREIQITKIKTNDTTPHIEVDGLKSVLDSFTYPLHFIDFETSAMPLPWYEGLKPYEGVAFQFSHHMMHEDGSIEHKSQYLNFKPGEFPNFEFVRELKKALGEKGTIFRYHNHENTYLRFIQKQLMNDAKVADRDELIGFIDTITQWKMNDGGKEYTAMGERNMVDLYDIVLKYYYSPHAKGSNSLKHILPAAIHDFPILKEKYSQAIYGKNLKVKSLNYESKIWISETHQYDPYKTLEPVFENYDAETIDKLVEDLEGLADGGSAMMAYNMLQFSEIPADQRHRIKDAMLRYCELDTMAMVMLLEGLQFAATKK